MASGTNYSQEYAQAEKAYLQGNFTQAAEIIDRLVEEFSQRLLDNHKSIQIEKVNNVGATIEYVTKPGHTRYRMVSRNNKLSFNVFKTSNRRR